ncbi:protein bax [Shimwellia blattae]|uniref:BAX protein n=1 Tax=Shimwellia blattae (strain ATCC 29907 / DSM 4481 / JCM 1650 / NBRC 105725 / CDC 9005-74) TaxID=630626 RepID=I2B3Z6_SHIBC|nr:protein bax [Shimwellia blattae]AFJ45250.1 BAX protein [Shimwellia blattae DSM 4481 = NBRC 105725]GAB80637.1 Bax protein [Shimwellia blattae DSM 4481 = NBRC 105725]VDY62728.1 Mannosyl-glycoprotein endo-beta-N-acetylglucosaminidase [Shimwellia blattae]VEC19520.1 Mannosyl-glycoprotein endo-beta-N-acetylglucosaminidase [Shimwellia blattae]
MISTPIRRFGAAILMLLTLSFSSQVLAQKHESKATSHKAHTTHAKAKKTTTTAKKRHTALKASPKGKVLASSKQEYSRNSVSSSTFPDLRKYPSGTPRKKAFLRTIMPYINRQNAAITADRNWLISKQYDARWSPSETARLKDLSRKYKVAWNGNTKRVPWNALLDRVDIIPTNMVATMAAAESGWGTSRLARSNNNLFGMKCVKGHCTGAAGKVKGYSHFESVNESVAAYVANLNTHNAYKSFRKERAKLRRADQEVTASNMIHKLKGYSTRGQSYNNYLFAMYQSNQNLMAAY